MKYLSIILLLSSCGMTVHTDPIKVDPITVTYNIDVNLFNEITNYCNNICTNEFQNMQDINNCSTQCVQQMISSIAASIPKGP